MKVRELFEDEIVKLNTSKGTIIINVSQCIEPVRVGSIGFLSLDSGRWFFTKYDGSV